MTENSKSPETADPKPASEPPDDITSDDGNSGYVGGILVDDKAGKIEAAMLATRALKLVARCIVDEIKGIYQNKGIYINKVVLYGGSDLPDFQALTTYQIQTRIIDKAFDEACSKLHKALIKIDEVLKKPDSYRYFRAPEKEKLPSIGELIEALSSPIEMVSSAVDVATKVLDYLRTDYSVKGIEVTADDLLLLNILAGELTTRRVKVMLPTLYNSGLHSEKSLITNELQRQAEKKAELKQKIDAAARKLVNLTTDESNEIETASTEMETASVELQTAFDNGNAMIEHYNSFIEKLTTPDDKARFPLATIVQQEAVQHALKNGASLMSAKISFIGGTNYTVRNLWNSLFGKMPPFFIRSGVVVNYNLFDGKTGQVQYAGAIPCSGGFYRVNELPQKLEAK
ncbi:hypothetical protein [Nodosilinea nodulosa]|uniref:hypothetical protein n=1 Tax=Nodosilinea nodulosa TaxID=416001 RepID=UPI000317F518|nr:hypothetical protein [Nodosilinea nodulosa]